MEEHNEKKEWNYSLFSVLRWTIIRPLHILPSHPVSHCHIQASPGHVHIHWWPSITSPWIKKCYSTHSNHQLSPEITNKPPISCAWKRHDNNDNFVYYFIYWTKCKWLINCALVSCIEQLLKLNWAKIYESVSDLKYYSLFLILEMQ